MWGFVFSRVAGLPDYWLSLRVVDPVGDPEALEGSLVEGLYAPRSTLLCFRDMGPCLLTECDKGRD